MFAGTGTLLVDDVTLLPGIHEEVAASEMPPQKGNRIYNSGFEAGPEGWTPTDGFVVDRTTAHSGRCSARLGTVDLPSLTLPLNRPLAPATRPRTAPPGLECRPFPVRAGMRYTLSAWIKAAEPNTRVTLRFFEWADEGGDQPSRPQRAQGQRDGHDRLGPLSGQRHRPAQHVGRLRRADRAERHRLARRRADRGRRRDRLSARPAPSRSAPRRPRAGAAWASESR